MTVQCALAEAGADEQGCVGSARAKTPPPAELPGIPRIPRVEHSMTILVAEDDPAVRGLLVRVLRRAGFDVIEAFDGMDALERWRTHEGPVALLLTDVVMPRLAGPELVRRLRQENPSLRVLYMSGFTFAAVLTDAAEFMAKPLHPGALVERIQELLGLV